MAGKAKGPNFKTPAGGEGCTVLEKGIEAAGINSSLGVKSAKD